jgi:hypothetical protein
MIRDESSFFIPKIFSKNKFISLINSSGKIGLILVKNKNPFQLNEKDLKNFILKRN